VKTIKIQRVDSYEYTQIKKAVDEVFSAFPMDYEGKKVAVKPNLLLARSPENASTTHPNLVRAVCEAVIARGGKPIITESGGGPITEASLRRLYDVTGMSEAAQKSGAELNYQTESSRFFYPEGKTKREFLVLKAIKEADILINLPKLKTHGLMKMTGATKNLFGVIPGLHKTMMHRDLPGKQEFASMICDLALAISPELTIMDAIVGMEGQGPSGGTPKKCGLMLSGRDVFSVDAAASYIMGITPEEAPILREAINRKLISGGKKELEIIGEALDKVMCPFEFPAEKRTVIGLLPGVLRYPIEDALRAYPYITDRCVSCGHCAAVCPQKTIVRAEKKFKVELEKCIRCYCCHEVCPQKAIDMKRKRGYPKS